MADASEIWHDDLLGRRQDANFLYILSCNRVAENQRAGREGAFVINVDAQWGKGKSYFLSRMYQQVLEAAHPAVFIDAWQYDFVDDPYSMVVSALDDYLKSIEKNVPKTKMDVFKEKASALRKNFGKILIIATKEIAKTGARKVIGEGVDQIAAIAGETKTDDKDKDKGKDKTTTGEFLETLEKSLSDISDTAIDKFAKTRLDNINETKRSLENFKSGLKDIISLLEIDLEKELPFFIFIDELDRCKPTYSIAMLERIKHLFDVTNVVFVMATDTKQLCYSINAVYGRGFDSKQYLGRFFHRSYRLPEPSYSDFAINMLLSGGLDITFWQVPFANVTTKEWCAGFFALTATLYGLSLRQFEQAIDVLRDINSIKLYDNRLEILYIFPFICEFVVERELGDNPYQKVLAKLKPVSDKWGFKNRSGRPVAYLEYFNAIHQITNGSLKDAIEKFYVKSNNTELTNANKYALRIAEEEHQHRASKKIHPETPSDLSNYGNLIVHVKRMHFEVAD